MGEKKETKGFRIYGNPWYLAIGAAVIILAAAYTGVLGTDFASSMALTMAYGILFYELVKDFQSGILTSVVEFLPVSLVLRSCFS